MEGGSYNSVGFSLAIDEGLINRMAKADKLIKDIGTHSEQTRDKLVTAFRGMGDDGVGYLISKLQEVQNKMSAINGGKISIDTNTIDQSISKTNTNIDKLAEGFKNLEVYLKSLSKRERINLIGDTKDYSGALDYSKSTKSIEEQIKAIKYESISESDFKILFENNQTPDKIYSILDKSETNKYDYNIYAGIFCLYYCL